MAKEPTHSDFPELRAPEDQTVKRVAELDTLRAFAAVSVVAFHFSIGMEVGRRFLFVGASMMELFFVLSGFLISSIILAHSGEPGFLLAFYARRGLRIWPAYYVFILALTAVVFFRPGMGSLAALPYNLTFTQNIQCYWFTDPPLLALPSQLTWSLAVEEQFYLLWPLLIALLGPRRIVPLSLVFIAVAIASRSTGFSDWILIARCDGFAIGSLLAVAYPTLSADPGRARAATACFALIGAASLAYLVFAPPLMGRPRFIWAGPADVTVFAVFFASMVGLVLLHQGRPALAFLRTRWLCYLGTISYGLYLYHMAVLVLVDGVVVRLRLPLSLSRLAIAPALTLAVAAISWAYLEQPCLRLKDLFRYGHGRGVVEPVTAAAVVLDPALVPCPPPVLN
jgi:peptidoglycan/LPS O-acetylase OafA/YrhL